MTGAFLIRHAEPVSPAAYGGTDRDRPLSPRGLRQAAWIAHELAGCGAVEVRTSPYRRCSQTAEVIAAALNLPLVVDDSLHIASGFRIAPGRSVIYVAHSNNIPVAMMHAGADCHACGHASCWRLELDARGRSVQAEYVETRVD